MIRDFKAATIQDLYDIIHTCEEETGNFNVFDYFEDMYSDDLEIGDYINNIRVYHEYMFDKYNMNEQILDAILQRVDETENSYAKQIEGYREMLEAFERCVSKVCEMIHPEKLNMSVESYTKELGQINELYAIKKVSAANKVLGGVNELTDIKAAEIEKIYGWLATDYKLTEEDLEEAAVILGRYFEPGTNQYELKFSPVSGTGDSYMADIIRYQMSDEEYQMYQLMDALYNKCDAISSFAAGFVYGIPFFPLIIDPSKNVALENEGKTPLDVASFQNQVENCYTQHPLATGAGQLTMTVLDLYGTNEAAKEISLARAGARTTRTSLNQSGELLDDGIRGGTDVLNNLKTQNLMDELASSGVKYNPDEVIAVTKTADGNLLWLEQGNTKSGMTHILERHADDFASQGVDDIPQLLNDVLKNAPIKTGSNLKGLFADYVFNGNTYRVAYGTNGYIVSFYPID